MKMTCVVFVFFVCQKPEWEGNVSDLFIISRTCEYLCVVHGVVITVVIHAGLSRIFIATCFMCMLFNLCRKQKGKLSQSERAYASACVSFARQRDALFY